MFQTQMKNRACIFLECGETCILPIGVISDRWASPVTPVGNAAVSAEQRMYSRRVFLKNF